MAIELATGYVNLIPSARGIAAKLAEELGGPVTQAAKDAGQSAGKNISDGLLANTSDTGRKLLTNLGLLALGGFAIKSALDVEDANNIIIRSTGATGGALDGLQRSFRNVASTTAASFDVVATTLSQLYQRTGLQGRALERLTSQVVTFNRISKDSPVTVQALTSALAGFNVPADQMGKILDRLFVISQKTGVPLNELLSTLQSAGPVARQFGFSVDFTAGFLAQLNKAGIDTQSIMPGLRSAFVQFAKDGREPAAALRETIGQIQELVRAGDVAGARQLAVQLFGARGVGLVDAAVAGKISLDSLNQTVVASGDGILDTASKTSTLSGAMGVLRNNLKLALAQFATPAIDAANDALRSILPTVRSLGDDFARLPDPIKIGAVALVAMTQLVGPLSNLGQAAETVAGIGKSIGTGFQLAAVRGLELVESIRAVGLAQAALVASPFIAAAAIVAIGTAVDQLVGMRGRLGEVQDALERGKRAGSDWASVIVAGAKANATPIEELRRQLDGIRATQQSAVQAYKAGRLSQDEAAEAAGKYGTAIDLAKDALHRQKVAQAEARTAAGETQASLSTYATTVVAGGDATAAFADLTDTAKKALLDFQSTLLAAAGGQVGYEQSLRNQEKAQSDYNDAVAKYGENSVEARDALLNLQQAQIASAQSADQLDKAQQDLIQGLHDGTISYDAQLSRLQDQIRLHPDNAAGIQLEIDKLNAAKTAADALPPEKITKYSADTSAFDAAFARIVDQLGSLPTDVGFAAALTGGAGVLPHAQGGIFTRPHVGLFAEAGAEAVLPLTDPKASWQIIAQSGLLSDVASVASAPASDVRGRGLFDGANVTIGDRNVIPELDYFTRTRRAGV